MDEPEDQVIRWRYEQLQLSGFDEHNAQILSERPDVDIHEAADLLLHLCSIRLAMRILL